MCDTVDIVGGPNIETPKEFLEWFGFEPLPGMKDQKSSPMEYPCMCGSDLTATFTERGIAFYYDGMGYFVGTPEELERIAKNDHLSAQEP